MRAQDGVASSETDTAREWSGGWRWGPRRGRATRREAGEAPMARRGCTAVPRSIALCALGAREAATDCIASEGVCHPIARFGGDVEDGPDPLGEPRRARVGRTGSTRPVDRKLRSVEPRIRGRKRITTDRKRDRDRSSPLITSQHSLAKIPSREAGWSPSSLRSWREPERERSSASG